MGTFRCVHRARVAARIVHFGAIFGAILDNVSHNGMRDAHNCHRVQATGHQIHATASWVHATAARHAGLPPDVLVRLCLATHRSFPKIVLVLKFTYQTSS